MWSNWWRRRRAQQLVWDRSLQHSLIAQLPTLAALPPSDHQRLAELTAEFLVDKRFFGADGLTLEPRHLITIATLACWPILRLGYDALRGWRELIVYPGDFSSQREVAEPIGDLELVHEYTEALSGESWDRGPLVLGWEAICEDLQHPEDGVSVVIHEIAHKLDARTGQTDGLPLLPRPMSVSDWSQTMSSAFAGFRATVEPIQGNKPCWTPMQPSRQPNFLRFAVRPTACGPTCCGDPCRQSMRCWISTMAWCRSALLLEHPGQEGLPVAGPALAAGGAGTRRFQTGREQLGFTDLGRQFRCQSDGANCAVNGQGCHTQFELQVSHDRRPFR